jgi:hypothetical protein
MTPPTLPGFPCLTRARLNVDLAHTYSVGIRREAGRYYNRRTRGGGSCAS